MQFAFAWRVVALALTAVAAATALSGCGALVSREAERHWPAPLHTDSGQVVVYGRSEQKTADAAKHFATMALFSQAVYRMDLPPSERWGSACKYLEPGQSVPAFGMPSSSQGSWARWTGSKWACMDNGGLQYETYVFSTADGHPHSAVLAFRGTENVQGQALRDWTSNIMAALGMEPPEYKLAQTAVKRLVGDLKAAAPNIKIYATGHSLGGGLAQQAGYLSQSIEEVYAFDPSPVTNWSQMAIHDYFSAQEGGPALIEKQNPTVFRIFHQHEALEPIRDVASRFASKGLKRTDYEFFFGTPEKAEAKLGVREMAQLHSMAMLACNLMRAFDGPSADFWLTRNFADSLLRGDYVAPETGDNPICPHDLRLK